MKYAVIYDSETGNTRKIAEAIYDSVQSANMEIINLAIETQIPQADIYFVGFPIHQKNCSMKIVDALEQIESGKVVLFATCGMQPTEKYKEKLEDALSIWLSDDVEYLGMYLCQGKTTPEQKEYFYSTNPQYRDKIADMLAEGEYHPDETDCKEAVRFTMEILHTCT